jgi:hypothetical protein
MEKINRYKAISATQQWIHLIVRRLSRIEKIFSALSLSCPRSRWIGLSFFLLNFIFVVRFTAIAVGAIGETTRLRLFFLGCAGLLLVFSLVGLIRSSASWLSAQLEKPRAILEIAIGFLVARQILIWILTQGRDRAIWVEVRSFFLGIFLWLLIVWGFARLYESLGSLLEKGGLSERDANATRIYKVGLTLILFTLTGYFLFYHIILPGPFFINYDPELQYMLNSLTPFKDLELYRRMDHPGTVLQILGSAFYILSYPVAMILGSDPIQFQLQHPGFFLLIARTFVFLANAITIVVLANYALQHTDWLGVVAAFSVVLLYFAVHPSAVEFLTIWSPNSFSFALGTLILLGLLNALRSNKELQKKQIVALGFLAGVLASFQVYLIAWTFGISATIFFYLLFRRSAGLNPLLGAAQIVLYSALGYIIATLVILPHYSSFLGWLTRLVAHQGLYGDGPEGLTTSKQLATNFEELWTSNITLFISSALIVLSLCVLLFLLKRKFSLHIGRYATAVGLIFQIALIFLLAIKHPHSRYLLSIAASLPILLAITLELLREYQSIARYVYPALLSVILLAFAVNLVSTIRQHEARVIKLQDYEVEAKQFIRNFAESSSHNRGDIIRILWTYGSYSRCYSLWLGNDSARKVFTEEIGRLCPSEYNLHIWNRTVTSPKGVKAFDDFHDWDLIAGSPMTLERFDFLQYGSVAETNVDSLIFVVREK